MIQEFIKNYIKIDKIIFLQRYRRGFSHIEGYARLYGGTFGSGFVSAKIYPDVQAHTSAKI